MKNIYNVLRSLGPIESNITEDLINLLPGNVFVVNNEGYLLWGNQRILNTLNLKSLDEYIGKHISYWDDYSWECCQAILKSSKEILGEESYSGHYYITKRKPLFSTTGEIVAILGTAFDITEQKQAHLAKQEFLQNMAHDIRTPLAGVIGLAQLQAGGLESLQESKEYGQMIYDTGNQLLELLNAVIKVTDTEQMTDSVKIEPLDLSGLMKELYALMEPAAYTKGLKLTLEIDQNLPLILSDRIKLKRIFLNILSNAVKFTKIGEIRFTVKLLRVEKGCANVEAKIADTGIGIARENINKIFDRFYREHPSYLAEYSGYGLGLYLVKEILTLLGGEINVASKKGKGSCFTLSFTFSLAPEKTDKVKTIFAPSKKPQIKSGCVLISEDNLVMLHVIKKKLKGVGYEVMTTMDGQAALETLKTHSFCWALLDIGLPKLKGTEVCKEYRRWKKTNNKPHLPIFVLTAHSVDEVKKECDEAGIDLIFTKPLTNKTIKEIELFMDNN
ncbi:ATP-binding protein [Rickettsiella massiliensis]|uniref:ATP-binding protein n=1 Tax=Rickettsiella massiliensis TaxID=676517 RepID=UPI00029A7EEE|nr:ATP-binding protein [Rickettsiella massiliensis]